LQKHGKRVTVFEYPIWSWCQWPFVGVALRGGTDGVKALMTTLAFPFRLLQDTTCRLYIGDVLGIKRAALEQHRSQMTRFVPDPNWRTLGDVSDGDFLACFFQEHEYFRRYGYPGH
jgi:hypothetical protein